MTPRPHLHVPFAYGAGLATGLAHFWAPAGGEWLIVAGAGAAAAVAVRRHGYPALLLLLTVLGWVGGTVAWRGEAHGCAARLPAARIELVVRLGERADSAGGRLRVAPVAGCRGTVVARWPAGSARPSGAHVRVTARWVPRPGRLGRPDGTLAVTAVALDSVGGPPPGIGDHLRNYVTEQSRRLYGERAAMVDALVLGRRADMDERLRDAFAHSGLVHLLSISGFHVGLIVAWVVMLLRAARLPRTRAMAAGAATAVLYVTLLGWPPPAARAASLAVLLAVCFHRQRRVRPGALLAATCLAVMLVDPWAVVDLGAWLSAGSLWGATTVGRWSDRAIGAGAFWRGLSASVGAVVGTAPITAAALGTVAPAGIVLNFAAIPLAAAAVPGVLASLVLAPLGGVAEAIAAGAGLALHLLEVTALFGARLPFGHIVHAEEPRSALPWLAVLGALWWGIGESNTRSEALRRWGIAAAAALWLGLGVAACPVRSGAGSGELALHFLDVGQGDAAVVRTPNGRWIVVDAGPSFAGSDAGRRVVVPFLRRRGARRVELVVVSHAHADHLGGVPALLERFPVGIVSEPGRRVADGLYLDFLGLVAEQGARWRPGRAGERMVVDGVTLSVLHPDTSWGDWGTDLNEDSVVLLLEYGDFQALFAGDAGFPAEERLRGRVGAVDLLKVGHHGSAGSSGDAWLAELQPRTAIVSAGRRNRYGHPAPAALRRLDRAGAELWRTDVDGTITVVTNGRTMRVSAGSRQRSYPTAAGEP